MVLPREDPVAANTLYKDVLLNHFRHPRNRDDLDGADAVCRAINTLCGDEIEVGIFVSGDNIEQVRFRGRGCSICIASASMMTEAVAGHTDRQAKTLCADIRAGTGAGSVVARARLPRASTLRIARLGGAVGRACRAVMGWWSRGQGASDNCTANPAPVSRAL